MGRLAAQGVNPRKKHMKTAAVKFAVLGGLFLGSAVLVPAVQITFRVNMEVQTTTGNFNPASHTVEVHGSFDGWGAGITLPVNPTVPDTAGQNSKAITVPFADPGVALGFYRLIGP